MNTRDERNRIVYPYSEFVEEEGRITWKIEQEDLESGIAILNNALIKGYYSPGEFLLVKIKKRKELDWIYCEYE
jgi:hypothetical protein